MNENNDVSMVKLNTAFEGQQLTFYRFRDKVCVVGQELGSALGYARKGQLLTDAIRDDWRNEFTEGKDYQILKGEELRAFKAAAKANGRIPFAYASHVLVLFESGVNLVSLKTEKDLGVTLRRLLADEVLPKLLRGEPILPAASPPASGSVISANDVEGQLRLLALRQKTALEIYAAVPGLYSEAFLRQKVEHAVALLEGRAPAIDNPLLSVEGYLQQRGVHARTRKSKASIFGKRLKALYTEERGREPPMQLRDVNHAERPVCSYAETDRPLFDRVFEEMFPTPANRPFNLSSLVDDALEPIPPSPPPPPLPSGRQRVDTDIEGWSLRGLLKQFKSAGMDGLTTTKIRDAAVGLGLVGNLHYGHWSELKNEHGRTVSNPWRYHERAVGLLEPTLRLYLRKLAGGLGELTAMTSAVAMTGKVSSGATGRLPFKAIRAPG
ncbi:hypothetical protein [Sorangium sp. So ce388]|uniref:hypothetical protein n=1 Tax=Sorangium sp. So ce388 TaxID=3133309 RepID=UPI003F5C791F